MNSLPEGFSDFIQPDCDRAGFIRNSLSIRGVQTSVVPINGKHHIYVNFPSSSYNPLFRIKTVLVHYDRVDGSPGANDNSAAVFAVMDWTVRLARQASVHNVRIFFTDGEELGGDGGVREQGAFGLASLYKRLGITNDDIYVFDACGRGTVPVVAKTVPDIHASSAFRKQFKDLYERTIALVRSVSPEKWLTLPVPYSDNAGFLASGIPAVAITLLPASEAEVYMRELLRTKQLEAAVLNRLTGEQKVSNFDYREKLPATWRLFHTPYDNMQSLTPESFTLMARLLASLASDRALG